MKYALFLAVVFAFFWAAPQARADVYVFPLLDQDPAYAQPYPDRSYVQPMRQMQAPRPSPCDCAYGCATPTAYQQPPASPSRAGIVREDRTVYFGFNKAQLNSEALDKLNSLAPRLMSADNVVGTRIIGYADRLGKASYNEALSRRRAENVRSFLISHGFIKPTGIETRWVGSSKSGTQCSKHLPRAKLLSCLQPDRKVEVNIDYRAQPVYQPIN